MRQKFIITLFLTLLLLAMLALKHMHFPGLQGQTAYFFLSMTWICGILSALFALNLVWSCFHNRKVLKNDHARADWANRRNTFRIIYPAFIRPVLVVAQIDNKPARLLEFPIMDLSQGGSCFMDDGSLGAMRSFSGHIRFENGDRIQVTGKLIRKTGNQISVQFQNAIDWSFLLNEQRRVLSKMKSAQ